MPRKKKEPQKPVRRKHGTGSVHQRKTDGRWQYSYMINGARITGYADSYEEADKLVLAAIAESKRTGQAASSLTVGEYLGRWIESRTDLRANTRYDWGLIIRSRLIPVLGHIQLRELTRQPIQDMVNAWDDEGLAMGTIRRVYLAPLKAAIIDAICDGLTSHNPCAYIRFPQPDLEEIEGEDEPVVLDIEQGQALIQQLDGHWLRRVVVIALALGARGGELRALKWKDIDLEAGTVRIRRNVAQIPGQGQIENLPKSKAGMRTLTIPDFALAELKKHRIEQNELRLQEGLKWQDLDLVFCREDGTHIRRHDLGAQLELALKYAQLPRITFHGLRHSAASILLALGVDPATVAKILGHAHAGTTLRVYGHSLPGRGEQAMNTYNDAWEKQAN